MNNNFLAIWLFIVAAAVSAPCVAAKGKMVYFSSGTGFFINREGYVVTNYHVISRCNRYMIYGHDITMDAVLVDSDKEHDLALLKGSFTANNYAKFADTDTPPEVGDTLAIIGYPGGAWKKHQTVKRAARILALKGPKGEDSLLQFSDAVALGNSGGPLLDKYGRVVGVVTGKSTMTKVNVLTNKIESVEHADVAVNLETIWDFLDHVGADYHHMGAGRLLSPVQMDENAANFIVNIRCPLPEK